MTCENAALLYVKEAVEWPLMQHSKALLGGVLCVLLAISLNANSQRKSAAQQKPATIEQLLAKGDLATAEQRLNERLKNDPMDVHAMVLFGDMRERQHLYRQAEASYRVALRADANSTEALRALATLLSSEDRVQDAIPAAEAWHASDGSNSAATILLASLYEKNRNFSESLKLCNSLPAQQQLRVLPVVITDRLMLGQDNESPPLIAELMKHAADEPQLVPELASALLRNGLVGDAAELIQVGLERTKPSAALFAAAAEAQGRQGHLEEANRLAERARKLDPHSTEALVVSGQIAIVQKQWKTAAEYFEEARKNGPPKISLLQSISFAYLQIPDYDKAHSSALQRHELQPDSIEASMTLANVFIGARHWGEADTLLDTVLAKRPEDKAAHLAKGIAQYNLGNLDSATTHLNASLGIGSEDSEAHYHLGLVAKQRGDIPVAIKEMEAALAIDPSRVTALTSIGRMYAQQGSLDQARTALERAIALSPDDPQSHLELATIYRRLSLPDKARQEIEKYQRLARSAQPTTKND